MSDVWETRNRLILEYLEKLARQLRNKESVASAQLEEQKVRLLATLLMLIRQHRVNKRGQYRYCSWRIKAWRFGRRRPQCTVTLLQRHEEDDTPVGAGPLIGLPQPTVPVGEHPQALDDWRQQYHPDQGHESVLRKILQFPSTRGDDFFQYPVGPDPYPSVNGNGQLVVPDGHQVRLPCSQR